MAIEDEMQAPQFGDFGGLPAPATGAANPERPQLEVPGRYTFPDVPDLGRGAIGRVRLAVDQQLGREVAIKELMFPPAANEATRQNLERRFLREARITARLDHPNVVPVHEIGRRADGTLYYVMKRVRGHTLRRALDGAADLGERLRLLGSYLGVCQAIAFAHKHGVIHRDVKPENVVLGEFGESVVLDWGLAKVRGAADDPRGKELVHGLRHLRGNGSTMAGALATVAGSPIGTPTYMSPEQAAGELERIDERSDVWGLGVVLYEILTGRPPFEGEMPLDIVGSILRTDAPPVASRCAEAPPDLAAVAEKALQRDGGGRYANAGELAQELEAWLSGGRVSVYRYGFWDRASRIFGKPR